MTKHKPTHINQQRKPKPPKHTKQEETINSIKGKSVTKEFQNKMNLIQKGGNRGDPPNMLSSVKCRCISYRKKWPRNKWNKALKAWTNKNFSPRIHHSQVALSLEHKALTQRQKNSNFLDKNPRKAQRYLIDEIAIRIYSTSKSSNTFSYKYV